MKKWVRLAAAVCFNTIAFPAFAQALDVAKLNPNAVAETLIRAVLGDKSRPLEYIKPQGISLVCIGKLPIDKMNNIDVVDERGEKRLMKPFPSKITEFVTNTAAKDKAAQAAMRATLEKRNDLAYVEYTTTFGPTPEQVKDYFSKMGNAPIDVYNYGTGLRDGSLTTSILLDRATFDKFVAASRDRLVAADKAMSASAYGTKGWSACGPAKLGR